MNEQIKQSIDKFKIPRPKVTIGEGLESAYLIPESELLSLLKLVAEDAYLEGYQDDFHLLFCEDIVPDWNRSNFEGYWKTLTEQL